MLEELINYWDLILTPFYLLIIFFIAYVIRNKHTARNKNEHYKYFLPALACKVVGGIGVCLIYAYYYGGGDPVNYFLTSKSYVNILLNDGVHAFIESADYIHNDIYVNTHFNVENGTFWFHNNDFYALFVVIITVPFNLLACKSFFVTTILLASVTFIGTWKLYEMFVYHFPNKIKEFAWAILFIPSVFFWGSGILKDTYTFCLVGLITYCIFKYFKLKERKIKYLIYLVIFCLLTIMIKPYILIAIIPGTIVWIGFERIQKVKNQVVRILGVPILLGILGILIISVFSFFGDYLGDYNLDNILSKAVATQKDLVREGYGTNNFNVGEFDASILSILSKFPLAVGATLFRPFIWEVRNPVMLISAIENSFILFFTLYVFYKVRIRHLISIILNYPLLLFSLLFSLFFGFSVGLTTANFGALVRLKIPSIPFYTSALIMILELNYTKYVKKKA